MIFSRAARVETNKDNIYTLLNAHQRMFVSYVLAIIGIVPVEIHRNIELHVNNKEEGERILKSWGMALGTEPEDDEY